MITRIIDLGFFSSLRRIVFIPITGKLKRLFGYWVTQFRRFKVLQHVSVDAHQADLIPSELREYPEYSVSLAFKIIKHIFLQSGI